MCRFIGYLGEPIVIEDLVIKPSNSLLMQSIEAKEADIRTNGDGFGIAWHNPEVSDKPGLFTSVLPAWNDLNLISLCQTIKTPSFFAHVRAANQGEVTQLNCHPFVYDSLMFMHNGLISGFKHLKREIQSFLDEDLFCQIKGNTDSEHIFALIIQYLREHKTSITTDIMAESLRKTVDHLIHLSRGLTEKEYSFLNLCLSDGKQMVACRFTDSHKTPARSLYYTLIDKGPEKCVMVTSEKLTRRTLEWHPITNGEIILVEPSHHIHFKGL